MRLKDKVAIVTGGSRGIGACIARRFGTEGARVAVVAHANLDKAQAVVAEITSAGGEAAAFQADISKIAEGERLVREVAAHFGAVDILVNNAALFFAAPIEETTEAIWDDQMNLNLKGLFFLTKAVVPLMKAKGRGKIVNVSSIAGHGGFPNSSAYCASKGGLAILTKAMCLELAPHKINVNALSPGNIITDMNAPFRAQEGYEEMQAARTPSGIGHMDPNELAGGAVFLASEDSNSMHGADILIDGGWAAW